MSRKYNLNLTRLENNNLNFKLLPKLETLPSSVDLRSGFPPIYDQGQLGSCTAQALCAMYYFADKKYDDKAFLSSRLFVYYNERMIENSIPTDSGASLTDGIFVLKKYIFLIKTKFLLLLKN